MEIVDQEDAIIECVRSTPLISDLHCLILSFIQVRIPCAKRTFKGKLVKCFQTNGSAYCFSRVLPAKSAELWCRACFPSRYGPHLMLAQDVKNELAEQAKQLGWPMARLERIVEELGVQGTKIGGRKYHSRELLLTCLEKAKEQVLIAKEEKKRTRPTQSKSRKDGKKSRTE
jgi:hypothetical protein